MTKQTLKVKRLYPDVDLPRYASAGAACFDISVYAPDTIPLDMSFTENTAATFNTGLAFEVPVGFVLLVFSRSGHGFNHDVRLANCVGVIDSDYRGELMVRLAADTSRKLLVGHGSRIAQAMLVPIPQVEFVEVDELGATERGDGGLGSTGQ